VSKAYEKDYKKLREFFLKKKTSKSKKENIAIMEWSPKQKKEIKNIFDKWETEGYLMKNRREKYRKILK